MKYLFPLRFYFHSMVSELSPYGKMVGLLVQNFICQMGRRSVKGEVNYRQEKATAFAKVFLCIRRGWSFVRFLQAPMMYSLSRMNIFTLKVCLFLICLVILEECKSCFDFVFSDVLFTSSRKLWTNFLCFL